MKILILVMMSSYLADLSKEDKFLLVIPESCFTKLTSFVITGPCVKKIISNSLSLAIVTFSMIFKIP